MATFTNTTGLNAFISNNPQGLYLNDQTLPGFIRLMNDLGWNSSVRSEDYICLESSTNDQYDIEIVKLGPDLYEVAGTEAY